MPDGSGETGPRRGGSLEGFGWRKRMERYENKPAAEGVEPAGKEIRQGILDEFMALCRIPHQSGHEQAISNYLCARLRELGVDARQDESWNVIALVEATPGLEETPVIALQAHMDMVVATNNAEKFDPEKDEVHAVVEGNILHTDGTSSLGADNGVGIAAILYMLTRRERKHGPLKIIFTSGEEVGLKGARLMASGVLEDVRYLINLDGFHSDRAIVGCMSGKREVFRHGIQWQDSEDEFIGVHLEISGMLGGHSGEDISLGRCNAIRMLAELLVMLWDRGFRMKVNAIEGGEAANVIPRSCRAYLALPKNRLGKFYTACEEAFRYLVSGYEATEVTPHFEYITRPAPKKVWMKETVEDVLETILGENNGVYAMSRQFRGCIGASSNLGQITTGENEVVIRSMIRCEADDVEKKLLHQHQHSAEDHHFKVDVTGYNAWHQDADNPLTRAVQETYMEVKHKPITVTIAPVGLEPACFHEKAPWISIVTLGADIQDAHATTERVKIDSMETMYRLIVGAVEKIQCSPNK